MESDLLIIAALALLAGVVAGWLYWGRTVAEWRARHDERDATAKELDEKFRRAIVELEGASVAARRVDELELRRELATSDPDLHVRLAAYVDLPLDDQRTIDLFAER